MSSLRIVIVLADNPCAANPCKNGGTCEVRPDYSYRCACTPNSKGSHCQCE
ncbi:Hypothetical predicted protein [Mytilus galloprovincialis]|uniref:EGF-like domain-containing protein n=1 Tax=Mytilus galloprovincialis TaxID=29158 RepID=A0A8B6EZB5_MYTGA|nr:Hypothetical predicted protein [Mytilus galloprovincialis]